MTRSEQKNLPFETNPELKPILESSEKEIKPFMPISLPYVQKARIKVEMLNKNMEDFFN